MKKIKTLLFSSVPLILAIGLQFLTVLFILFLASIYFFIIAPSTLGSTYTTNDLFDLANNMNFNIVISIIFSVLCIVSFYIWYSKSFNKTVKIDIKKSFHPYEVLGIVLLVPGTQFLSGIVTAIVSTIFPEWLSSYMELLENAGLSGEIPLLMMIYAVLLAPFSEELIFRGVTLSIARRAFPFWIANTIQALFFGIFHMNPLQGCYTFVVGLIIGYICEKGGTLYHAILFHLLFNLWGTTASSWLDSENEALMGLLIILGSLICLVLGFLLFRKGIKEKSNI